MGQAAGRVWWLGGFGDRDPAKRRQRWAAEVRVCAEGESWAGWGGCPGGVWLTGGAQQTSASPHPDSPQLEEVWQDGR